MYQLKPACFFEQSDLQELLKLPHTTNIKNGLVVHDFNWTTNNYYNPLKHVSIVENNNLSLEENMKNKTFIELDLFEQTIENKKLLISAPHKEQTYKIILCLKKDNEELGRKLQERYRTLLLHDKNLLVTFEKLKQQTPVLMKYLKENNFCFQKINVDFSTLHKNNLTILNHQIESLQQSYININTKHLEGYNDLDYYPFIFENYLVIEDVAASKFLIFHDNPKTNIKTWYAVERDYGCYQTADDTSLHDFLHNKKNHALYAINHNLTDNNILVKYNNTTVLQAQIELTYPELLVSHILDDLKKSNLVPHILHNDFKTALQAFTLENDPYMIEERNIISILSEIEIIDSKFTYKHCNLDLKLSEHLKTLLIHQEIPSDLPISEHITSQKLYDAVSDYCTSSIKTTKNTI